MGIWLTQLSVQILNVKVCHHAMGTDCCFISAFEAISFISTNKKLSKFVTRRRGQIDVSFLLLWLIHLSVQIKNINVCHQEVGTDHIIYGNMAYTIISTNFNVKVCHHAMGIDCRIISGIVVYKFISTSKKCQSLSPGGGDR